MHVERLRIHRFRAYHETEWNPMPGINLVTGGNGAGKTTLLEALHLLANGRSFRGRVRDGLVQHGQADLEVFAEWSECEGRIRRAGLRHSGREWTARLDAEPVASLSALSAAFAVLTIEPGSHELIAGGSEKRRQFVDWALFHVEPDFLVAWKRYTRALKQRNALLKSRPLPALLEAWNFEMTESGESITRMRSYYLTQLEPLLARIAGVYLPEFGAVRLEFQPGWRRDEMSLDRALMQSMERDRFLGHSSTGPHRADWRIAFERHPGRQSLSRGQQKLVALCCVLAQGHSYAGLCGEWPVIALDDLASELDREHQERVLEDVMGCEAQVLMTGTEIPESMRALESRFSRFHVEQGQVRRLV